MAEFFSVLFAPEFFPMHFVFLFIFGLLVGSFLNVCIYRIPAGMSIVHPGSHCTTCGHYLKWHENIPIFSYLIQSGQCRRCGTPFSPRYMFVELLTGLLFIWVFWVWRYNWATPLYLVFTAMLIVGTFTDIDHWIIPDSMTWGGAALALAVTLPLGFLGGGYHTAMSGPFIIEGGAPAYIGPQEPAFEWIIDDDGRLAPAPAQNSPAAIDVQPGDILLQPISFRFDSRFAPLLPFANALAGAVFGFGLLWIVGFVGKLAFRKEAMGMGDMKLFAFIGAIVGWFNCLWVLVLACLLGVIFHFSIFLSRAMLSPRQAPSPQPPIPAPAPGAIDEIAISPSDSADPGIEESKATPLAQIADDSCAQSPADDREQRVLAEILKQDIVAAPNYHPLPFGPYIAMAAIVVLLYHDRLNTFFRNLVLGIE